MSDMEQIIKNKMKKYLEGKIALHTANVQIYMHNPAGIGEHSDIMEAIEDELGKAADARDKLELLDDYI